MNDHSRHGAARAVGEHRHDPHGPAEHAGHGHGHEHLGHAGHADVYRRRFWVTLIEGVDLPTGRAGGEKKEAQCLVAPDLAARGGLVGAADVLADGVDEAGEAAGRRQWRHVLAGDDCAELEMLERAALRRPDLESLALTDVEQRLARPRRC